jgi:ATP-dependent Clp protease ATP-binding subunit ClpC
MVEVSTGISWAWAIACTEAERAQHSYIEMEDLLIGIFSLEKIDIPQDWFPEEIRGLLTKQTLKIIKNENVLIKLIFERFSTDLGTIRRMLRDYPIPMADISHRKIVDMSFECRTCFNQAKDIAVRLNFNETSCLHLLIAILENPNQKIRDSLADYDLNQIKDFAYYKIEQIESARIHDQNKNNETTDTPNYETPKPIDYTTPILNNYGTDLTQQAREGKLEQLIGRNNEMLQLMRTLSRKKKNNPLIIGEAGVGKTALIRGLASKINVGEVPGKLRNKRIVEIDMGNIVAGTKYRGEFEEKLTVMLRELKDNPDIILFIDEIHSVIGAGSVEGSNLDASDILKPALAQGDICCIGATTINEFRRYFEKDMAMERRFQPIMVEEPSIEDTVKILNNLKPEYEKHHSIKIEDPVIENVVKLSVRYIHDRKLPDKALDLLDEACSRKSIPDLCPYPLLNSFEVTTEDIANVLEELLGIPIKIGDEEKKTLLNLEKIIGRRIIGQDEAIGVLSKRMRIARSGLQDPNRPYGVFLFLGPTGVGKTELAKNLAQVLFGSQDAMIRLDMSEFMSDNSESKLIGAPPGYLGYGDEGQLTGALRTQPYSVVLLDEIEKAHPKIFDLFLQVFDEGTITDSQGRVVDAKNTIFIMTSNLRISEDTGFEAAYGIHEQKKHDEYKLSDDLLKSFKPEFINRINEIIIFNSLKLPEIVKISKIMVSELKERLYNKKINLEIESSVYKFIAKTSYDPEFGARPLRRVIEQLLEDPLSEKIIRDEIKEMSTVKVRMMNSNIHIESNDSYSTSAVIS